ncbi:MAG: bifunctional glutamate N-acetyltransferase/amino-acid acetyltransferase ArgJ [Pseudomonadota bacterium]
MTQGFRSPFTPNAPPQLQGVEGVAVATAEAGIKYRGRKDVCLFAFDAGTTVAGTLTQSACASAPVEWCRKHLVGGRAKGLLVNSGNANAFTGQKGREAVETSANVVAEALHSTDSDIFLASTGVIGEPLEVNGFAAVVADMAPQLSGGGDAWLEAARAIMTTDTFPKGASRRFSLGDDNVVLTGIAKGAGMIAPDMATMLAFVATDAAISPAHLQSALSAAVAKSFNAITIDSDTSTSDTVLLFATGKKGASDPIASGSDPKAAVFQAELDALCLELAHMIVKDGEGLTKFVTVQVNGAVSDESASIIARSIGNSPLVKTAFAGCDANWGRVVMAVGKAGQPADRDRLAIWFGNIRVAFEGARDPNYVEEEVAKVMQEPEITLTVDLGLGCGEATIWTCDLTKEYVAINGDYRT